jgi:hypothetical protein
MVLTLVSIEKNGLVRIAAEGRMTAQALMSGDPDCNPLDGLLGPNWANNRIVLDFGQVCWVDSAAIGWLMTCNKTCRKAGGMLVVHSVQPGVRQLIDLLRIDRVLTIAADESAAMAAVATRSHSKKPRARKSA